MSRIVYSKEKGFGVNNLYTDEKYKVKFCDDDILYDLSIDQDEYGPDPREEFDPITTMVCWSNRYELGDEHNYQNADEFKNNLANQYGNNYEDKLLMMPLYIYDHSGIAISTSDFRDPWDSWQIGWVYISKEKVLSEIGGATEENWREKAKWIIDVEVNQYDSYVRGDVYGYTITKPVTEQTRCPHCGEVINTYIVDEEVDNCYGFYGYNMVENGLIESIKRIKDIEYIEEV